MPRIALLIFFVLLAAPAALAGDTETSRFLGQEGDWPYARLELRDVRGSTGGVTVALAGSGTACVRLLEGGMQEKRYLFSLEKAEALALLKLALEGDLLGAPPRPRDGKPGEARIEVVLENALGERRSVFRWQTDPAPAFEKVEGALRALAKKCEGKEPAYAGKYTPFFLPLPAVRVTVLLYRGKPDPSFELVRPEDWEKLRALLLDLPETEKPAAPPPRTGFRGFGVLPRQVPGLPRALNVFAGTVKLDQDPASPTYEKDQKGLEAWLEDEAKKRGIEIK